MKGSITLMILVLLTLAMYFASFYYSAASNSVVIATGSLIYIVLSVISILVWLVIFIYSDSKNKLPWLFVIALFPVLGLVLYSMLRIGFQEIFRYRRRLKQLGDNYDVPIRNYDHSEAK